MKYWYHAIPRVSICCCSSWEGRPQLTRKSANCQLCLASWIYFHKVRIRIFYIGFFKEWHTMGLGTCPHQKSASVGAWVWIPSTHMEHWAWWCMLAILVLELQTWIPGAHGSNTKSVSSCCRSDCLKKVPRNWGHPGWPLVSSHKGLRFNHP